MVYTAITLGELFSQLDQHSWKNWVFTSDPQSLNLETKCLIIDTNLAETGKDDFTPLIAEQEGMLEFLSVQDMLMVREYLKNVGFEANSQVELFAVQYYFDRDAYPTKAELMSRS